MDKQEKLQELHREALVTMANLNDMDKTVSRLRNELLEIDPKIVEKLDGENQ